VGLTRNYITRLSHASLDRGVQKKMVLSVVMQLLPVPQYEKDEMHIKQKFRHPLARLKCIKPIANIPSP
jgi:hypothetical protein